MRHLIDPLDFTQQEISTLLDLADRIHDDPAAYQEVARHKKLATLFYEPSTRTRLSFEAAMLNLGGHVLGFPSENVSSASKGESVADTIRVVSCYADIVAMRHPKEGAPLRASRYSRIPVINAGDGGHQHPTQTLTDLMTIRRRMGRLDDLTIGLCGDLKFGRTVHSLIKTMARCKNIRFVLISPEELRVPDYIVKDVLEANGIPYQETRSLEESMSELDILYMTRVQKERFFNEEDYIRLKNSYILTKEKMDLAKPDMAVLHPLPRVNEIALDVDMNFTQRESCGKCVPCREGTKRMLEILERIVDGKGEMSDLDELEELANMVQNMALCGLGKSAPLPVISTLKRFRNEYEEHIRDKKCRAKVCTALRQFHINPEFCIGCGKCAKNCPAGAISGKIKHPYHIDNDICIKCGACKDNCNFDAVYVEA